jgi:polysaccharide deacetylase family protein (PEP-CTERM system associated)
MIEKKSATATPLAHALTIDVEDYFQVSAFSGTINRESWDQIPCRVEANVDRILDLLDESKSKATFFTLGWIAKRFPKMVKQIVSNGHELASHGYGHHRIQEFAPKAFREDIVSAKNILEDIGGVSIQGYRAPSFSVGKETLWAFDEIKAAGYAYSSSVYPVKHDLYGMPDAPRFPYRVENGLLEIPMTTARFGARNVPAGGGGFFRLFPYEVSRRLIERVERKDSQRCMIYLHPWEFDPAQPKVNGAPLKSQLRHRLNLNRTIPRFKRLLSDFTWDRVDRVFAEPLSRGA